MESQYYTVSEYLNCRKFNKRYYTLCWVVNSELLNILEQEFGKAQIQEFSQFNPEAKDSFHIKNQDGVQISGVLAADLLYLVTPLKDQRQIDRFEALVHSWVDTNCRLPPLPGFLREPENQDRR